MVVGWNNTDDHWRGGKFPSVSFRLQQFGISMLIMGSYGFAPASLVSPLGVVALISNCIIAPCLLKEHFRHRDFWGVLVAVGGVVTLVLSSKGSEDRMGPGDIKDSITRWEFMLYLGLTASTMLALVWASSRYGHKTLLIDLGLVGLFGRNAFVLRFFC